MARYVYNGTVRDKSGRAVPSSTVTVYEADTTTGATIYEAKSGGVAVVGSAITADTSGRYKFYVDDSDYFSGSQFDLLFTKVGYGSYTLEDESVF